MTTQWKPTTTTINQYSSDAAVDIRVAHTFLTLTFALIYDLDFQHRTKVSRRTMVMTNTYANIKVKGQLVQKPEKKHMDETHRDGQDRSLYLIR